MEGGKKWIFLILLLITLIVCVLIILNQSWTPNKYPTCASVSVKIINMPSIDWECKSFKGDIQVNILKKKEWIQNSVG